MRVDVIFTADAVDPAALADETVLVVDVLRASTTMITALAQGAVAIVPVAEPEEAQRRAADLVPEAVVAGERGGEMVAGFHVGNSPVAFASRRWDGRPIVFTTSNGTRALLAARAAAAVGVASFVNLTAAARWAVAQERDVTIICAGERGRSSLEDTVCAGFLVARMEMAARTPTAEAAMEAARPYAEDVGRLAVEARWAQHLARAGHGDDVRACLVLDATALVPLYMADVDKVVLRPR